MEVLYALHCVVYFFKLEQFYFHSKIEQKVQRVSLYPLPVRLPDHQHSTPVWYIFKQSMNLHIIINQTSSFTLVFTLGVVHSVGLDKHAMHLSIDHCDIIQNSFTALEMPCSTSSSLFSPECLVNTDLFTVSVVSGFSRMLYSWNHTVTQPFQIGFFHLVIYT